MLGSHSGRTLSVVVFFVLVAASVAITLVASRRANGASGFFVAGRRISARQNGLAIVGEVVPT